MMCLKSFIYFIFLCGPKACPKYKPMLFQKEVVEGEEIYACNVCNGGFEKDDKIKRHVEKYHYEIVLQIRKDIYEEHDDSLDAVSGDEETYGENNDAFLAKFDQAETRFIEDMPGPKGLYCSLLVKR